VKRKTYPSSFSFSPLFSLYRSLCLCLCLSHMAFSPRNLVMSRLQAEVYDVDYLPVGYMADTFGHISQVCWSFSASFLSLSLVSHIDFSSSKMPQIYQSVGVNVSLYSRGLPNFKPPIFEHWWEGADGTRILGMHLPSYCTGSIGSQPSPNPKEWFEKFMRGTIQR
jgi:hypothetical protein